MEAEQPVRPEAVWDFPGIDPVTAINEVNYVNGAVGPEKCLEMIEYIHSHKYDFDESRFDIFPLHRYLLNYTVPNVGDHLSPSDILGTFLPIAALCDPWTQPSDTGEDNRYMFSVDLISDLAIALIAPQFQKQNGYPQFAFAFSLEYVISHIMEKLRCCEVDSLLAKYPNSQHSSKQDPESWEEWLPYPGYRITQEESDFHDLMLMYKVVIVSLMVIFKMYRTERKSCPFILDWVRFWQCSTLILLLCLEVDRDHEDLGKETPPIVVAVAKGMGAIRNILSVFLNDSFDERMHDLKHETLNNFMSIWARKTGDGSLRPSVKELLQHASMLTFEEVSDDFEQKFEQNFEYDDFVEEDLKYMFEFELDQNSEDEEEGCGVIEFEIHPECHCEFPEEESVAEEDNENKVFHTEAQLSSVEKRLAQELKSYTDDPKKAFNSTELVSKLYKIDGDPKTSFKPPLRSLFKLQNTSKMVSMSDMTLWTFLMDQLFGVGDFDVAYAQIQNTYYTQATFDYVHELVKGQRRVNSHWLIFTAENVDQIILHMELGFHDFKTEQEAEGGNTDKLVQVFVLCLERLYDAGYLHLIGEEVKQMTLALLTTYTSVAPSVRRFRFKIQEACTRLDPIATAIMEDKDIENQLLLKLLEICVDKKETVTFDIKALVKEFTELNPTAASMTEQELILAEYIFLLERFYPSFNKLNIMEFMSRFAETIKQAMDARNKRGIDIPGLAVVARVSDDPVKVFHNALLH
ncbi:unnamed protein product [Kuraishia capsulata CBS 1993]|uniref:Uncharacterized protein n=1 Tax=Kuraishia capsulata CBS 1993 TaxID=1382522 RepID=W6MHP0_9ASCO|nr:uncharacterized protein KUCA_T00001466001 [Kuraishia capsulata CBS 1993]CDK25496.1 unnamed protein product [Kuraishia capsulata CBS 1993]